MTMVKRVVGVITVLVGVTGMALSVLAIVQACRTTERLKRDLPQAIGRAESVVTASIYRAEAAVAFLQTTREQLKEIEKTVERFATEGEGRLTSLFDRLDVDVVEPLERAEEFVRSLQSGLQHASSMIVLFESFPFLAPRASASGGDASSELQHLASNVNTFNRTLEQIADALAEIRSEGRADAEQIALLQKAIRRADDEVQGVQVGLEELRDELDSWEQALATAAASSGGRIRRMEGFVLLFFVCFAVSQASLAWNGLRSVGLLPTGRDMSD